MKPNYLVTSYAQISAFAEQQRLLKRKLAFEKRLGLMASRRAAGAAHSDSDSPPVPTGVADEGSE